MVNVTGAGEAGRASGMQVEVIRYTLNGDHYIKVWSQLAKHFQ